MPKDITVHFVGNARDLAAASAEASVSVDRVGNVTAVAGAKAEAASFGFSSLLIPLVALAAAIVVATAPITVLATTFGVLAAGVVGLAAVTGNLGDISGQAAASAEDLAAQQLKVKDAVAQAAIDQTKYNDTVKQYGVHSLQAQQALIALHGAQATASNDQEKLNAMQAQGQGPIAGLIAHIKDMANTLGQQAAPMARELIGLLDRMIPVVESLGSRLISWFGERLPAMLPIITQIVQAAVGVVLGFAAAWGFLVDWFMAHWSIWMASIKSIFDQIGTGVHFVLPLLGLFHEAFVRLGPVIQFIRDHADSLKPLLYAVGALLVVMAVSAGLTAAAILLLVAAIAAVAAGISFAITHIHAVADAFWAVVHAVEAAIGAIGRVRDAIANVPVIGGVLHSAGIPGFQAGGVVPGPLGAPMLAMVHGGETVTPPGRSPSGTTYNINVAASPLASPAETGRAVVAAIQEYERRSGTAWRS